MHSDEKQLDDLNALEKKILEARNGGYLSEEEQKRITRAHQNKASMQAGYEFVASVLLSAVLGYFLDNWLGTSPAFLILLFLLGTCVGFMTLYRLSKNLDMSVGFSQLHQQEKDANKAPTSKDDDLTTEDKDE